MDNCIDILLATYNGAGYIGEQIQSIQAQTHQHWKLLIRDDGSKDHTVAIIKTMAEADSRIQLVSDSKGNLGAGDNFRELLSLSTANYIAFCDQDDVWLPSKLTQSLTLIKQLELTHTKSVPLLVHSDALIVDANLNVTQSFFVGKRGAKKGLNAILFANPVQGATTLVNNTLKRKFLAFNAQLSHDHHAALLAEMMGARVYICEPLMNYRQHSQNLVGAGEPKQSQVNHGKLQLVLEKLRKYKCPSETFKLSISGGNVLLLRLVNHFEAHLTREAQKNLKEFLYLFEGNSLIKKCWIAIKNQYGFYSRKDILCLLHHIIKKHQF